MDKKKIFIGGVVMAGALTAGLVAISPQSVNSNSEYSKINEHTLKVTKSETRESTQTFDLDFLYAQRDRIQEQKDRDNALRDAELEEVNKLISEARKLGVKTKEERKEELKDSEEDQ